MSNTDNGMMEIAEPMECSQSMSTPMQRKENLRLVLTKTQNLQNNSSEISSLEEMIVLADSISIDVTIDEKATCQDEIVMDSHVMTSSARHLHVVSTSLTKNLSSHNERDFAARILSYAHSLLDSSVEDDNNSVYSSQFEDEVVLFFRKTAYFSTLLGCLDPLEKKTIVRQQRRGTGKRDILAPMKKPKVVTVTETQENSVEETVARIKRLIVECFSNTGSPIDYYRIILHPQKFGKTVENTLHVAFLVRDKRLKMTVDENGSLLVEPTTRQLRRSTRRRGEDGAHSFQNVMSMRYDEWKALVELYQITEPFINF